MTQRSQDRQHTGKRGAAQRKARRAGYASAAHYSSADPVSFLKAIDWSFAPGVSKRGRHTRSAFDHGRLDWARKHKEIADV